MSEACLVFSKLLIDKGGYAHQYQSFVERIRNAQRRDWAVAFWGGEVLPKLWHGYYLCFPPDRWDMLCACTFVEHVQEPSLDLLPRCRSISVSTSSKQATFPGLNRLRPVASSSRLKGLVSSVGGWLLLGTIVLWWSSGGIRCSTLLPLDSRWLATWSSAQCPSSIHETVPLSQSLVAYVFSRLSFSQWLVTNPFHSYSVSCSSRLPVCTGKV